MLRRKHQIQLSHNFPPAKNRLAEDGLITVLEKMPASAVPAVEVHRIPGEHPLHDNRYRCIPGAQQQMEMVRQEGPGVTGSPCLSENVTETAEKILPIRVILINPAALNRKSERIPRSLLRS